MWDLQLRHVNSTWDLGMDRGACIGNTEPQPLDHQGSPHPWFLTCRRYKASLYESCQLLTLYAYQYSNSRTLTRHTCTCWMLSYFSRVRLLANLWTVAHQASLSRGCPGQEYSGRLPFPSPGDLPDPEIKPWSLVSPALAGRLFTTASQGNS